MRWAKGEPFAHLSSETTNEDGNDIPTFSFDFLYDRVGKEEARFILGVAEEYEHLIAAIGTKALKRVFDVKPRLAQRLGLPKAIEDCLEDAISTDLERFERDAPAVTLEHDEAHQIWEILHFEYRRLYDPEHSMDKDQLRLYHKLTDSLGHYEQDQRQKEIDKLPEKLEKQKAKRAGRDAKKEQNDRA